MSEASTAETTDTAPRERLRDQAAAVKEDVRELGRLAKEVSQEKLRETKLAAGEYVAKGRKQASEFEDSVITYIRDNPVKSVLIATGAGALLGLLFSRR